MRCCTWVNCEADVEAISKNSSFVSVLSSDEASGADVKCFSVELKTALSFIIAKLNNAINNTEIKQLVALLNIRKIPLNNSNSLPFNGHLLKGDYKFTKIDN